MATAATLPTRSGVLRSVRGARRLAWAVVGWNIFVALWGAVVRSTQSGAGCGNNWPLCNGQVIPVSPTWHTVIEFVHRQTVTISVLTLIALVVWTFRATPRRSAARIFAGLSTLLLVNEAFLGALLVLLGYVTDNHSVGRVIVLSIHLSNTLLMLGAMTMTARMLSTGQQWSDLHARGTDKAIALTGLLATLIVGVSGSLAALGDTLFPSANLRAAVAADFDAASPWLLRLRGIHPLSAAVAGAFVLWLILRSRSQGKAHSLARIVLAFLALQFVLGIGDVLLLAPTWMQILHLFGADLYWVALVVLASIVVWPPSQAPVAPFPRN